MRPRVLMASKKRPSRPRCINAAESNNKTGINPINSILPHPGFLVTDRNSNKKLLVDTGALVSIWPSSAADRLSAADPFKTFRLTAANSTPIATYGTRLIPLRFGVSNYEWEFVIADVDRPLLGADFFDQHELLVDVHGRRFVDARSLRSLPGSLEVAANATAPIKISQVEHFSHLF